MVAPVKTWSVMFVIVTVMPFILSLIVLSLMLEIVALYSANNVQRCIASAVASLLLPVSLIFCIVYPNAYSCLGALTAAYRSLNMLRLIKQRRQADHLLTVVKQTSSWLIPAQILLTFVALQATTIPKASIVLLMSIIVIGCSIVTITTQRSLRKTRPGPLPESINVADLPTISVLIPARNETADLNDCLESLVASTYQKLEIIVLDDCSQNQRTPEIIKGFAQAGVRFIAGGIAPDNWLAKNYAYEQLAAVANGELLLFCGVDTRFKPETLAVMVNELVCRRKAMVSFIPANQIPPALSFQSMLVQPSRYAWELMLPRRLLERPPVLSTTWLIQRDCLQVSGGFKAIARAAVPERAFARYAAAHNDGYSFVQSNTEHGVSSVKSFSEQQATAIRMRYPQLHQSMELTLLTTLIELTLFVLPIIIYGLTIGGSHTVIFWLANLSATATIIAYAQICNLTYRKFLLRSVWLLPFAALCDVMLLNYSMMKYEFSSVEWKGRNICIPVMQVIRQLPKV